MLDAKALESAGTAEVPTHAPWNLLSVDEEEYLMLGEGYEASDFGSDASGQQDEGSSVATEAPAR